MNSFSKIVLLTILASMQSFAAEPSYCNPKNFFAKEIKIKSTISNARLYKLGNVLLLGAAIGNTKAQELMDFATTQSSAQQTEKFCTWYFNEGNTDAEKNFTHIYLNNPSGLTVVTGPKEYSSKLKDEFANARASFLSCALQHKYIALGCNGQKHRGPTVFGMLLSFSGCEPANSAKIVNTLWGLNGIKEEVRTAIILEGKKMGDLDPEARLRLQQAFGL